MRASTRDPARVTLNKAVTYALARMTLILLTAGLIAGGPSTASSETFPTEATRAYAKVLSQHVSKGRVDYRGIKAQSMADLDKFLSAVAEMPLPENRNRRIGLLADAYNALVLKSVIRHGRPRSVLDVKGFFSEETHLVAGKRLTLDELEKKVLNPFAKDPRTHFVLVCAAVGCPILESRPFYGTDTDKRMDVAVRRYLESPHGANARAGGISISKIFDWYAGDFGGADGARAFVLKYLPKDARKVAGDKPAVGFLEYNWTLNQS